MQHDNLVYLYISLFKLLVKFITLSKYLLLWKSPSGIYTNLFTAKNETKQEKFFLAKTILIKTTRTSKTI